MCIAYQKINTVKTNVHIIYVYIIYYICIYDAFVEKGLLKGDSNNFTHQSMFTGLGVLLHM